MGIYKSENFKKIYKYLFQNPSGKISSLKEKLKTIPEKNLIGIVNKLQNLQFVELSSPHLITKEVYYDLTPSGKKHYSIFY